MVYEALRAAAALEKDGISTEVVDLRSLQPLDERSVIDSVNKTGRLVVADTGWKLCGVSAEVAAIAAEQCHARLKAPVRRICLPATPTPACHSLEKAYYPTFEDIVRTVKELTAGKK
jgi:pyruvate dehydrogenase E1 component beta subunit